MKGLLVQAGLWKEIKLNPSASSPVPGVPSLEFFSCHLEDAVPSSTAICGSC